MFVWDDTRKIAVAREVVTTEALQKTFATWDAHYGLAAQVQNTTSTL
jgi:hypothetical protein